jgi:DNA-binding XRE family transcriptional regulator
MSKRLRTGESLWIGLYRAAEYRAQASRIEIPQQTGMTPELATQRWLDGMARNFEQTFAEKLRNARERAGLTQQRLAQAAQLSVTGLAMIERGERLPGLDTATRICWALDVVGGGNGESRTRFSSGRRSLDRPPATGQ